MCGTLSDKQPWFIIARPPLVPQLWELRRKYQEVEPTTFLMSIPIEELKDGEKEVNVLRAVECGSKQSDQLRWEEKITRDKGTQQWGKEVGH